MNSYLRYKKLTGRQKYKLLIPVFIIVLTLISLIYINTQLGKPNPKQRQQIEWVKQEADSIFGGSGSLAPQMTTYNCDVMAKLTGSCYIRVSSQFIFKTSEFEKYISLSEELPNLLLTKGWKQYESQYPTSEISKNTHGVTKIYIAYSKNEDGLYCELLYAGLYDSQSAKVAEPIGWHINCKSL